MNITCYHNPNTSVGKQWLAHMELAPQLYMSFFGATEADARLRAENWYAAERERQDKIWPEAARVVAEGLEKRTSEPPIKNEVGRDGRGAHFVGTVWVLNHATREKLRVPAAEVASYEVKGFVRGGARTQFRS